MNTETMTNMTTKFSARAAKGWLTRRQNAVKKALNMPTCLCGCGGTVVKAEDPAKQKKFLQGHDAKAKSLLCEIIKKRKTVADIPVELRKAAPEIAFIQNNAKFAVLFAPEVAMTAGAAN